MNLTKTFGPAWVGSGTLGFFGEGYRIHRLLRLLGLDFTDATFVGKTTTFPPNQGHMPLNARYEPVAFRPDCVWMDPIRGIGLNSVALSGPGFVALLETGRWQKITDPYFLSFMPLSKEAVSFDQMGYMEEALSFTRALQIHLPDFASRQVGLQLNISCPNVGANLADILSKASFLLEALGMLGLPIVVKLNLLVSPEAAAELACHPACAGLVISNTLPFGELMEKVSWRRYFPNGSPLPKKYGGGGLSGTLLFPLVRAWVKEFRRIDTSTYLNAGGGIMHPDDVDTLADAGADSISFASVAVLRPWRVPHIIERAHKRFS